MLQEKDINKISELKNGFTHRWVEPDFIFRSLKVFSISSLFKSIQPVKMKGYSFEAVFSILMALPFIGGKTVYNLLNSPLREYIDPDKDTFYRLKNNADINWRDILWKFVEKFRKCVDENSHDHGLAKCLIVDDSLLAKSGRYMEKISRVWDHVAHQYILGYKLLAMAYWDGYSSIITDFTLHREKGKNAKKPYGLKKKEFKKQHKKRRKKEQPAYVRSREADESKIECAISMVKRALSKKLAVDYLLIDSWFTCRKFIDLVVNTKTNLHLIGMFKIAKTKFDFNGKKLTYSQINNDLGKAKRCRKLRTQYKEAQVELNGVPLILFFSRQGSKGKWKVFLTTDTKLSFIKMLELYQIRWTIEVFFKEAKQLLGLGKCQSKDFDAQIAETTLSMIQHLMLTMKYRFENYESKGALFDEIKEDIIQHRLNERLWGLLIEVLQIIDELLDSQDMNDLIEKLINDDKVYQKLSRLFVSDPPEENQSLAA